MQKISENFNYTKMNEIEFFHKIDINAYTSILSDSY